MRKIKKLLPNREMWDATLILAMAMALFITFVQIINNGQVEIIRLIEPNNIILWFETTLIGGIVVYGIVRVCQEFIKEHRRTNDKNKEKN